MPGSGYDRGWATAEGRALIEQWISYAMSRVNAYRGSPNFNANKQYRINPYGILEGRSFRSNGAPSGFPYWNNDKYYFMWDNWIPNGANARWNLPEWNVADNGRPITPLRDYVRARLSPASSPAPVPTPGTVIGGPIGTVWQSFGGAGGLLGSPISNVMPANASPLGTRGSYLVFQRGIIVQYLSGPRNGQAYAVSGPIGGRYGSNNEGARLGMPTMNEGDFLPSPYGTVGRWQAFENGMIFWSRNGRVAGRALIVLGAISQVYYGLGGSGSFLGVPISDEYAWNGGRRSDFEGGYIFWTPSAGARAFR